MKLIRNIKYKLWNYFRYRSPIFISFKFWKPFQSWWKVRKIFKKPIFVYHKLKYNQEFLGDDYFYIPITCHNKWLFIDFDDCQFKLKYNEIRFESVPSIVLIWKQKIVYVIGLEAPEYEYTVNREKNNYNKNNLLYWEGILTYLYEFNKDLYKTYLNNIWEQLLWDKDGNRLDIKIENNIILYLKEKYQKTLINRINLENEKNTENK